MCLEHVCLNRIIECMTVSLLCLLLLRDKVFSDKLFHQVLSKCLKCLCFDELSVSSESVLSVYASTSLVSSQVSSECM